MGTPRHDHGGLAYMSPEDIEAARKTYEGEADGWKVSGAGRPEVLRQSTVVDLYEGFPEMPVELSGEELTRRMIESWLKRENEIWAENQRRKERRGV